MHPEENGAVADRFQSKPPECTAAAKLFPKGICEPASMKILDQAKFLSKRRGVGVLGGKLTRSYLFRKP